MCKRPAEAVAEARKIVTPGEPSELSPTVEMYRDTKEVLGFALLDFQNTFEAQKALRAAAAAGSVAAQHYLAKRRATQGKLAPRYSLLRLTENAVYVHLQTESCGPGGDQIPASGRTFTSAFKGRFASRSGPRPLGNVAARGDCSPNC